MLSPLDAPASPTCITNPTLSATAFEKALTQFLHKDLLYARETEHRMTCSVFAPLTDALNRAGIKAEDVYACLFAGGRSLIPQVRDSVKEFFASGRLLMFEGPSGRRPPSPGVRPYRL